MAFLKNKYIAVLSFSFLLASFIPSSLLAEGQAPAPDFKLQDIYQDKVALSDYKDKQPVVLFFWSMRCPVCVNELKFLNNLYVNLVNEGIELLSVDIGDFPDDAESFVSGYNLAYRVLLDKDTNVANAFGVTAPAYVLINKEGKVVFQDSYFPQGKYKKLMYE